ncbi:MAG: hypothetical protein ACTSRG_09685 [Candidatus Helarchaeota archaeon]
MNIFEIIDYNLQSLNITHLINSIIRSSIVIGIGIVALIIIYNYSPQKAKWLSVEDLNPLKERENFHIVLGIIGFFVLGSTGYAYALSVAFQVYYSIIVSAWVNISFLLLSSLCIKCYNNIKYGLIPIIIGWSGAVGGLISIFLVTMNPILSLILEIIILSFLPSLSIWFIQIKSNNFTKKITFVFGISLLAYGVIKLTYFILFVTGFHVGFVEFLYNISPTILDIICIFGPITLCFLKCETN